MNGQVKRFDPEQSLPPKQIGWIVDPKNPDPFVLVEQYPPCEERIKRLKRVCGGHVMQPFCKAIHAFIITDCVHCGILARVSPSHTSNQTIE